MKDRSQPFADGRARRSANDAVAQEGGLPTVTATASHPQKFAIEAVRLLRWSDRNAQSADEGRFPYPEYERNNRADGDKK